LAVNAAAVATPFELVVAVTVEPPFVPPVKVPAAPVVGAVKVTVTPLTGLPPLSFTVATRAVGKSKLMVTLCGVPAVAVMLAGGPAVLFSENAAGVATPLTVALTV